MTAAQLGVLELLVLGFSILTIIYNDLLGSGYDIAVISLLAILGSWNYFIEPILWRFRSETGADYFAFKNLKDDDERREVLCSCMAVWGSAIEQRKVNLVQRLEWGLRLDAMRQFLIKGSNRRAHNKFKNQLNSIQLSDLPAYLFAHKQLIHEGVISIYDAFGTHGALIRRILTWLDILSGIGMFAAFFWIGVIADSMPIELLGYLLIVLIAFFLLNTREIKNSILCYSKFERALSKKIWIDPNKGT